MRAGPQRVPRGLRLAAAGLALACAAAPAQGPVSSTGAPDHQARGLDLSLDLGGVRPRFGARSTARKPLAPSPAASLPDPRALKGAASRGEETRLRLNLKGFSLLELEEEEGARVKVRRVREREWRRPLLSLTIQKRF